MLNRLSASVCSPSSVRGRGLLTIAMFALVSHGAGCAEEAESSPAPASETPLAVASVVEKSSGVQKESLEAEREALEKQRAEVEALRAKLADAEKDRDQALSSRRNSRSSSSRERKVETGKSGSSGRRKIVLDPDDGNPI